MACQAEGGQLERSASDPNITARKLDHRRQSRNVLSNSSESVPSVLRSRMPEASSFRHLRSVQLPKSCIKHEVCTGARRKTLHNTERTEQIGNFRGDFSAGQERRILEQQQLEEENKHFLLAEAVIEAVNVSGFANKHPFRIQIPPLPRDIESITSVSGPRDEGTGTGSPQDARMTASLHKDFIFNGTEKNALLEQSNADTKPKFKLTNDRLQGSILETLDYKSYLRHRRIHSADAVALALLDTQTDLIQPIEEGLEWLVADGDTPQKRLPLPKAFLKSLLKRQAAGDSNEADSEDACNDPEREDIRGNGKWAPPRAQLILTKHRNKKKSEALSEQHHRCAGCHMKMEVRHWKTSFRLCHYFGRYFCVSCHHNETSIIPAKVIFDWSFKEEPVSCYGGTVIRSIASEHLFHVEQFNHRLVNKVCKLKKALRLRMEAGQVFPYLMTCRRASDDEQDLVSLVTRLSVPDSEAFSLNELVSIWRGEFTRELADAITLAKDHIYSCPTCHLHGHICEGCRSLDVLFPFQDSDEVKPCGDCGACFHRPCWENVVRQSGAESQINCPKCLRISIRRRQATPLDVAQLSDEED